MLKNYFKITLRALSKDKIFAFINIIGLGLGIASFLFIFKFISFEESYESFIPGKENLYRVTLEIYNNNSLSIASAENFPGVGPALVDEFAEVLSYTRLYNMGYKNNVVITYEEAQNGPVKFKHRKFLYADSSFLPLFGYELIRGDAKSALAEPFTAVLSESYANKYFGDQDPIGKMLRLKDDDFNDELVKVTGIFKDTPQNTHLKFDILFSYKTLFARGDWAPERYGTTWQRQDMYTYIKLKPGTDYKDLESKLIAVVNKYKPNLAEINRRDILQIQPITDIHLKSNLAEEPEPNGDARIVNFLKIIAAFILIIAWVNYINLATARAMERASEVGVRKVMGAFKSQLMKQFLMESGVINLLAILLALGVMALMMPQFKELTGLRETYFEMFSIQFILIISGVWLTGTILSGIYPAFVLSTFKPVSVLKGKLRGQGRSAVLRKVLVVIQFATCVALIASTIIIYQQLNFMKNQDIGMEIEQILVIERPGVAQRDRQAFMSNIDMFKNEVARIPSVQSVTGSLTIPGKKREFKTVFRPYGSDESRNVTLRVNSMDYEFMETFGMDLIAGRNFSRQFPNDPDTSAILTKSASDALGFENPDDAVGKTIAIPNFRWARIVVGVVNDYYQESLKKPLDPVLFFCWEYNIEFYSLKVNTGNLQETISQIEDIWQKAFPGNPFQYFFLEDYFNRQYQNEEKFGSIFTVFAILAIVIGGLGLFALSSFTAHQRTKEIGIRKVLGSTVSQIHFLLSKNFMILILFANLIAWPVTWYFMESWLQKFANRIEIDILIFIAAGAAVMIFALITVSYQTLKAANVAPVNSLRYE